VRGTGGTHSIREPQRVLGGENGRLGRRRHGARLWPCARWVTAVLMVLGAPLGLIGQAGGIAAASRAGLFKFTAIHL
jgi:hypothetical protein